MSEISWDECESIRDLPEIDELIRNLIADPNGDNATCLVREIVSAYHKMRQESKRPKRAVEMTVFISANNVDAALSMLDTAKQRVVNGDVIPSIDIESCDEGHFGIKLTIDTQMTAERFHELMQQFMLSL